MIRKHSTQLFMGGLLALLLTGSAQGQVEGSADAERRISNSDALTGIDLIVVDASVQLSTHPNDPGNVRVSGTAIDTGGAMVSDPVEMYLRIDGNLQFVDSCTPLEWQRQGGCPMSTWITLDPGNHEVLIEVDPFDHVQETNNQNNTARLVVDILGPSPDLVPTSIDWAGQPEVGLTTGFEIEIINLGAAASPPTTARIELFGAVYNLSVPGLAVGASELLEIFFTPQVAGVGTIEATVDPFNLVIETREDNNFNFRSVTVEDSSGSGTNPGPLPDLVFLPQDVTLNPPAPRAGQLVYFQANVRNSGPGPVTEPVTVRFSMPGFSSAQVCQPPINIGEVCALDAEPWIANAGTHTLTVTADPLDAIEEVRDDNNTRLLYFNVTGIAGPQVTCEGIWTLIGIGHSGYAASSGSVVDDCEVYWGMNTPIGCWRTSGSEGLIAQWYRDGGAECPTRVKVFDHPIDGDLEYSVTIE